MFFLFWPPYLILCLNNKCAWLARDALYKHTKQRIIFICNTVYFTPENFLNQTSSVLLWTFLLNVLYRIVQNFILTRLYYYLLQISRLYLCTILWLLCYRYEFFISSPAYSTLYMSLESGFSSIKQCTNSVLKFL